MTTSTPWDNFKGLITAQGMWGAVIVTLMFILIGYYVTKKGIFTREINGKLAKFTLEFALPFLTISAFMAAANKDLAKQVGVVLGLSLAFYLIFHTLAYLVANFFPRMVPKFINRQAEALFKRTQEKNPGNLETFERFREAYLVDYRQKLMAIQAMIAYGSLQFFAVPIVDAMKGVVFDEYARALLQVWNLPYMIGAFGFLPLIYSGDKFSKKNAKNILKQVFSPMMICLYVSLLLWAIQFIPGADTKFVANAAYSAKHPYTLSTVEPKLASGTYWETFRIQLPALGNAIDTGSKIISPLAWLVIGGSLAVSDVKKAAKNPTVWITTVRKLFTLPLVVFLVVLGLVAGGVFGEKGNSTAILLVLLAATPPAAVCTIFSVTANHKYVNLTSEVSTLSTIGALIAMPVWTIIAKLSFDAIYPVGALPVVA